MKKLLAAYLFFLMIIWGYFLFFYPLDTYTSSHYAAMAHAMYFSKLPLEWLLLYTIIKKGWSIAWMDRIEQFTGRLWLKTLFFSLLLTVAYQFVRLPFNVIWFAISRKEGTSNQTVGNWFYELGLDSLFFWLILAAGIYAALILMGRFKNWWFGLWLLALPAAVFVVYIQPVWIDPLYEDFTAMEPGPLRTAIEDLTEKAGLEDATLLQVDMSEKTTTFNAYVTGIMGNARIVLWDTTLKGMPQEEVLFILNHEIGHYLKHHVYIGVAGYLLLSLLLLYAGALVYRVVYKNVLTKQSSSSGNDLRAVPILLLIFSLLLTAAQPLSLAVSRQIEASADRYAVEKSDSDQLRAGISSFHRMAEQSKSDVNPAFWIKWMRYSHPPIQERIDRIEKELTDRETNSSSSS
ncbi:M48 family metalloprotease [Sediminibacillus halophilus]|uniref:Zn-dependent protease with chaperone function n=1 Tax=Sediminibacillus halophilus TaxID=482461 RepID=A0A1G9PLV2_9BACI|nr:M48 family metalloprotease [Sediminibacillus halophilus]SDL99786.1 Zn-dependent protease with chaperone function [Sediminibacillus halophilus]